VLILLRQFCALLLNACKELVYRVNPQRSESVFRLKRTPLPVLAFTPFPDDQQMALPRESGIHNQILYRE
jgi:hypothetical protein